MEKRLKRGLASPGGGLTTQTGVEETSSPRLCFSPALGQAWESIPRLSCFDVSTELDEV